MEQGAVIAKGLVIAGTHSGAGKTTVALGLMAALRRRGLYVAPFKVGPDFIDPGHHTHLLGCQSRNLDGWMLSRNYNLANFQEHAMHSDVAVVEGVMGLFDGYSGSSEEGSTAQMAKWLNLPVLLVVNAASMARSVAALVQGFERFDPRLRFAGTVFNNLGSEGHLAYLEDAMDAYVDMPVVGGLLRNEQLRMPERHLGLTTAQDHPLSPEQVNLLADHIESGLNLDRLVESLPEVNPSEETPMGEVERGFSKVRVGVARDRAFCFYYPENLELLASAGAEVVPFSPLADEALPPNLDGLYFGGGYPEIHARQLTENRNMRASIRDCSQNGMPIYGECGGFMYLCRELQDGDGTRHSMCDCFPFRTRMHSKLRTLGYREVQLNADTALGTAGQRMRGHEFHYSDIENRPLDDERIESVYKVSSRKGGKAKGEGYRICRTIGSYIHLHFGSCPDSASAFVDECQKYKKEKSA